MLALSSSKGVAIYLTCVLTAPLVLPRDQSSVSSVVMCADLDCAPFILELVDYTVSGRWERDSFVNVRCCDTINGGRPTTQIRRVDMSGVNKIPA